MNEDIILSDYKDCQVRKELEGSYGNRIHRTLFFVCDINTKIVYFEVVDKKQHTEESFETLALALVSFNRI